MLFSKKYNYLKKGLNKKSGKNFRGKITVYHKGGGNKNLYRFIDFKHKNKQGKGPGPLIYANGEGYYLRRTTEGELGSGAGFAIIRG